MKLHSLLESGSSYPDHIGRPMETMELDPALFLGLREIPDNTKLKLAFRFDETTGQAIFDNKSSGIYYPNRPGRSLKYGYSYLFSEIRLVN